MKRRAVPLLSFALSVSCSSAPKSGMPASVEPTVDAGLAALGAEYVEKRGCPQCHQSTNRVDGILSGSTTPLLGTLVYPRNLTPDPETGLGTWSDDDIARAIRDGFAPGLAPLCIQMSRFDRIGDPEVKAMIAYLRSIPAVRRLIPPSICPPIKFAHDD
ncbi:MAG TPA: hypothetical protein VH142_28775 [Polyangiaceae bacterium]|nr:hypothetical protein [Polyangiaceae bacterium]